MMRCHAVSVKRSDRQIYGTKVFVLAGSWGLTALSRWNRFRVHGNFLKVDRDVGRTTTPYLF